MRTRLLLFGVTILLTASAVAGMPVAAQEAGSASVAAVAPVIRDLAYGPNARHRLDVYPAAPGTTAPIVVTLQNSAWVKGDKSGSGISQVNARLQEGGYVVFSIDTRLATEQQDGVPMITDDIERAVKWVVARGASYGGQTDTISLLGGSAGAQLVSLAGELINAKPGQAGFVDGVIEMSGLMDFVAIFQPAGQPRPPDGTFPKQEIYLGCLPSTCTVQELKQPSPAWQIRAATCPAYLLINADAELTPLAQPQVMQQRLVAAGCRSNVRIVPGSQHGLALFIQTQGDVFRFLASL